ncbi:MAG: AraC family transcriptional regulator [Rhodospirillaceae bacterium]|nr:MAG: AraC family transcriptional regulator [Rhodospirillaceae bacterium]
MSQSAAPITQMEAEVVTAVGLVQIVHRSWAEPIDQIGALTEHRLALTFLPRSHTARGCFPDSWGQRRFEPIGELFLVPAGETVHAKSECRRQTAVVCMFAPESVRTWFDGDPRWTDERLRGSLDIVNPSIRNLLLNMGKEISNPGFASNALIELMAAQTAIELGRHCLGIEDSRPSGGLASWRLRIIDERLTHGHTSLTELAGLCDLSVRQLARAFRVSRGCSIGTYIANSRILLSKQLLMSDRCVKSVAHAMGFNTPSNFTVAFRRATGETPREYRERARVAKSVTMPTRARM